MSFLQVDLFKEAIDDTYSGSSNFETVVNKSWYVDKTLLIKAVFKDMDRILISAPRGFGKSTNLSMLKTFFEIEMNDDGKRVILLKDQAGYLVTKQEYSKNFNLFKGTKIFRIEQNGAQMFDETFFTNHFGRYPSIYVNFTTVSGDTYDEILDSLRSVIHDSFMCHAYLKTIYNKPEFIKYIDEYQKLNEEEIRGGLKYLSSVLCNHFRSDKKVYVFIDEYDAPISNAIYNQNICGTDLEKILSIISGLMLRLLKDNPHVGMAHVTARRYVGKVLSPSNIVHHPFLQSDLFGNFYGFTGDEVEHLLKKKGKFEKLREVKDWYGSYSLKLHGGNCAEMYNPWSIINYLCANEKKTFWSDGSCNELLALQKQEFKQVTIKALLRRQVVTIKYQNKFEVADIVALKLILEGAKRDQIQSNEVCIFLQFFYENGFLNVVNRVEGFLELNIANNAIYAEICRSLFSSCFFIKYYKMNRHTIAKFGRSVRSLITNQSKESFKELAISINGLFTYEESLTRNHFEFQACLFYLLNDEFGSTKSVALTQPKTCSKCDIALIVDNEMGVVMELKLFDDGTSIDALDQILVNKYYSIIDDERIENNKIYLGIHMSRDKEVTITYLVNCLDKANAKTVCSG